MSFSCHRAIIVALGAERPDQSRLGGLGGLGLGGAGRSEAAGRMGGEGPEGVAKFSMTGAHEREAVSVVVRSVAPWTRDSI